MIAIIDKSSLVFTRIKKTVKDYCGENASQTYIASPPSFPYIFVDQKDNPSTGEDMSNNENAVEPLIEITVYTKGDASFSSNKNIHKLSDTAMRDMGFKRTFGPQQITNVSDTSITRLVARYSRVIGSDDTL